MTKNSIAFPAQAARKIIAMALEEDLGIAGDITTMATVPAGTRARAVIAARKDGCISGLPAAEMTFHAVDDTLQVACLARDGDAVRAGQAVLEVSGNARAILTAERTALNIAGRMSGIATLTRSMVEAVGNHKARICHTRKTTPGLRALESYAVRTGGGHSHRLGLFDAILIKDNHIVASGGIAAAVAGARAGAGHLVKIEVEVDTLEQLDEALAAGVDVILLDNMTIAELEAAVARIAGHAVAEASGGVSLDTVAAIAATGVDVISSGALTHSAANFDLGLDFLPQGA